MLKPVDYIDDHQTIGVSGPKKNNGNGSNSSSNGKD
jgi:hypothetical protein